MGDVYAFSANNSELLVESEIESQLISLKSNDWFHGVLERKDAEKKILSNGEFLVRLSIGSENKFVVSTKWNGKYVHVVIKNDVDISKKQLMYYIVPKFKFSTIAELITFHKVEQYPLSNTSEAVLYRAVLIKENNKKEHKFRKSVRVSHKFHTKTLPRSDSETLLGSQRYSGNFPEMNKSLTELPTTKPSAPNKPFKPSLRLFSSKLVLPRYRPNNIQIKNDKLFKENGDYSDYSQSRDSIGGLERERARRGLSVDVLSPSLFGLNRVTSDGSGLSYLARNDSDGYLPLTRTTMSIYGNNGTSTDNGSDYINPSMLTRGPSLQRNHMDSSCLPPRRVSAPAFVFTTENSNTPSAVHLTFTLDLNSFLDLNLASLRLPCCGPIEGVFDTVAINKAATFLLSHSNNPLALCTHLLHELRRIFQQSCSGIIGYKPGFRSIFLSGSRPCQNDLSIRQSAFSNFVKATIVNTTSDDRRIQLILFWIKCADGLVTHVKDMFHFRSVVTAIFSDQISNLNVWKRIYRDDPSLQGRMKSLRNAIRDGCFMRADIEYCVPDLVQLHSVFSDETSQFDEFCDVSLEVATWSNQAFDDPVLWLTKITNELDSITTVPFLRELVRTETMLCLIVGKSSLRYEEVVPMMAKVEGCISAMADLRNQAAV